MLVLPAGIFTFDQCLNELSALGKSTAIELPNASHVPLEKMIREPVLQIGIEVVDD